jgi:3-oxoacyl-[acyl-carrier-protein] synthase-3
MGSYGREAITFGATLDNEGDELVKVAVVAARECLAGERSEPETAALVISQSYPGFGQRVADELGATEVYSAPAGFGLDPHTAAPMIAYTLAIAAGTAADLLFVAAGAGPVAAASLYRRGAVPVDATLTTNTEAQ